MNPTQNNNQPLNQSEGFSSHTNPETNPFTADLKGEFSSNFGTNTNAVSEIFKSGDFNGGNKNKNIFIILFLLLLIGGLSYFLLMGGEEDYDTASTEPTTEEVSDATETPEAAVAETKTEEASSDEPPAIKEKMVVEEPAEVVESAPAEIVQGPELDNPDVSEIAPDAYETEANDVMPNQVVSGSVSLIAPGPNNSIEYNEGLSGAKFTFSGPASHIIFSRHPSLAFIDRKITLNGGSSYTYTNPKPGTWFWAVMSSDGSQSEVRSFTVSAPARANVTVIQPQPGSSIAANGGIVSWQTSGDVTSYRVEMIPGQSNDWANPTRYATASESAQLNGAEPGQYQMRVGAFSRVSGRWEYTSPFSVSVQ